MIRINVYQNDSTAPKIILLGRLKKFGFKTAQEYAAR
jgi:hypothetical protein